MMGEELNATEVTKTGLIGDRAYALIDNLDGKVATAQNPRQWPTLFDFRAVLADAPRPSLKAPPSRITFPEDTVVNSEPPDIHRTLSEALKREVTLSASSDRPAPTAEEYWLDIEGLDHRDAVTDFGLPEGTFFDCAFVHLLTAATLDRLRVLYPQGRFEVRRFRPNIVVEMVNAEKEFAENATLPQGDLPKRCGYPAYGSPAKPRKCWGICLCVAGWQSSPWRLRQTGVSSDILKSKREHSEHGVR
jgi:uncharacterized protein YcbX